MKYNLAWLVTLLLFLLFAVLSGCSKRAKFDYIDCNVERLEPFVNKCISDTSRTYNNPISYCMEAGQEMFCVKHYRLNYKTKDRRN